MGGFLDKVGQHRGALSLQRQIKRAGGGLFFLADVLHKDKRPLFVMKQKRDGGHFYICGGAIEFQDHLFDQRHRFSLFVQLLNTPGGLIYKIWMKVIERRLP